MVYVYPAVFEPDDGGYSVSFPDVKGCATCADSMSDALLMAEDALSLMLVDMEERGEKAPKASDVRSIQSADRIVSLVRADTAEYRKRTSSRAVKKTLTIPQWMNEEAEKRGINFSQVLQEALTQRLG